MPNTIHTLLCIKFADDSRFEGSDKSKDDVQDTRLCKLRTS